MQSVTVGDGWFQTMHDEGDAAACCTQQQVGAGALATLRRIPLHVAGVIQRGRQSTPLLRYRRRRTVSPEIAASRVSR